MGFDFAGTYTKIEKHKLIEYTFGDRSGRVEFVPSQDGVAVRVTFDAETEHSARTTARRLASHTRQLHPPCRGEAIERVNRAGQLGRAMRKT